MGEKKTSGTNGKYHQVGVDFGLNGNGINNSGSGKSGNGSRAEVHSQNGGNHSAKSNGGNARRMTLALSQNLLYLTQDDGHSWAGGNKGSVVADEPSQAFSNNDDIWDFFAKYSLP